VSPFLTAGGAMQLSWCVSPLEKKWLLPRSSNTRVAV